MDKTRQMEDEMSRFEAEISGPAISVHSYGTFNLPGFGNIPPPPMPPVLIPQQHNLQLYLQNLLYILQL
ncbi:hypothetical protein QE152_g29704 [Popillia japonica]|uniref:Uncharacterized protein n=1 Tax=Popillia japonica TaxID=7064 RepID=A0AAW1JGV6_POPJA